MNFIKIPDKDFEMMDAPVTQDYWEVIMRNNQPSFKKNPKNPVTQVSWNDVQEFIKRLSNLETTYTYRLPTEGEWEYCAKSCDDQPVDEIAWHCDNSESKTHPVKQKKPNAFGLYDMLGNVWELTDSLSSKDGSFRVIRGGCFYNYASSCKTSDRNYVSPEDRFSSIGFRLVRTIKLDPILQALAIAQDALRDIDNLLRLK